jgi:hypothetical protein
MALDRHMHGGEPLRSEADMRAEKERAITDAENSARYCWLRGDFGAAERWTGAAMRLHRQLANLTGGKS